MFIQHRNLPHLAGGWIIDRANVHLHGFAQLREEISGNMRPLVGIDNFRSSTSTEKWQQESLASTFL